MCAHRLDNVFCDVLQAEPGSLVVVTGPTSAGKSTLLQTLLGNTVVRAGRVHVAGTLAYVPQTPWVTGESIRDNILFGRPLDPIQYSAVLHACCLDADIRQLPHGDATLLGEGGAAVSGGQKQRIALARVLYAKRQIICLDDVLASLDARVSAQVFERAI
ncbi:uncharacterized protein MONBRDRAFT_15527, partial [Monosiga brevicollis MX1]